MSTGATNAGQTLDSSLGSRRDRRARLGLQWFEAERFTLENLQALSVGRREPAEPAPRREVEAGPAPDPAARVEATRARQDLDTWEDGVATRASRGEALWNAVAAPPLRPGGRRERRRLWLAASLVWALALACLALALVVADAAVAPATYAPELHLLPRPVAGAEAGPRHLFGLRGATPAGAPAVALTASL